MVPPRKRRRKNRPSPAADEQQTLPTDLLLEIVARSDPATLIRCAAACRLLRRDILDPSFLRRVTRHGGAVPPGVLAYLHNRPIRGRSHNRSLEPLVSLVHPATPAASSFTAGTLAPYVSRHALHVLRRYDTHTSRGGLVVLSRGGYVKSSMMSEPCPALCVLDPMTGDCSYLSAPPDRRPPGWYRTYVLLTAADDGIVGRPFSLLVTDVVVCDITGEARIAVQAAKTTEGDGGTSWGPATFDAYRGGLPLGRPQEQHEAVVLHGGIIHWLLSFGDKALTYDVRTETLGTVKLPPTGCGGSQLLLGRSPDGRLRLLAAERFMVSVWLRLPDSWVKESVIDVEQKLLSLNPNTYPASMLIDFECSRERSGAVLLRVYRKDKRRRRSPLIVLDLETKEMRKQESSYPSLYPSLLFEVDLSLRLQAMKIFS